MGCGTSSTSPSLTKVSSGPIQTLTKAISGGLGVSAPEVLDNNVAPDWSEDDAEIRPILELLVESCKVVEPPITSLLQSLEADFNGKLDGLEHKFKTEESLFRKIRKIVDRKRVDALNNGTEDQPVDIPGIIWGVTDALRYTMLLDTAQYTTAVKVAVKKFEEQGIVANEMKNFWPGGDNYQGINDVFQVQLDKSPNGHMLFEVQFHTPESFQSKMQSHHFYETFRSTKDPKEKIKNWQALCEAAQLVPVPEGVLEIPEKRNNPNPGEMELYAELALERAMKAEPDIKARVQKSCPGALKVDSSFMKTSDLEATLSRMVESDLIASGHNLQEAVNNAFEALNILVVFPEDGYVRNCLKAVWALEGAFSVEGSRNGWLPVAEQFDIYTLKGTHKVHGTGVGCGLGWCLQVTTASEDDGVAFTNDDSLPCLVTLHTQASLQVQEQLIEKWADYRSATSAAKRRNLAAEIRQLHESVKIPDGARDLERVEIASV